MLFLEIGWFNFQEKIVVLARRLKFFSAGFCIFRVVTCGGEVDICAYEEKIGISEKQLLKHYETASFYVCRELYQWSKKNSIMQFILVLLATFIFVCTLSITNLDIFRLGYMFTHSIGQELVYIDPSLANVPIG